MIGIVTPDSPSRTPIFKRPWFWVVLAIAAGLVFWNVTNFPAGRYECTWRGEGPSGELAGDLYVTVGSWPNTYPLKARIHTATGAVELVDWTHSRRDRASEFYATIPIAGVEHQALCELP